jgi:hypothetical protein
MAKTRAQAVPTPPSLGTIKKLKIRLNAMLRKAKIAIIRCSLATTNRREFEMFIAEKKKAQTKILSIFAASS